MRSPGMRSQTICVCVNTCRGHQFLHSRLCCCVICATWDAHRVVGVSFGTPSDAHERKLCESLEALDVTLRVRGQEAIAVGPLRSPRSLRTKRGTAGNEPAPCAAPSARASAALQIISCALDGSLAGFGNARRPGCCGSPLLVMLDMSMIANKAAQNCNMQTAHFKVGTAGGMRCLKAKRAQRTQTGKAEGRPGSRKSQSCMMERCSI